MLIWVLESIHWIKPWYLYSLTLMWISNWLTSYKSIMRKSDTLSLNKSKKVNQNI